MNQTHEEVIQLVKELGSITAAAQELGVSKQRIGQIVPKGLVQRKADATCIDCGQSFTTRKEQPGHRCTRCRSFYRNHGIAYSPETAVRVKQEGHIRTSEKLRRSHCHQGHSLIGDNLYISPNGDRHCRICRRDRHIKNMMKPAYRQRQKDAERRYYQKKKALQMKEDQRDRSATA